MLEKEVNHLLGFVGSFWPYFVDLLGVVELESLDVVWDGRCFKQLANGLVLPDRGVVGLWRRRHVE
jgi:hypothetical protein